MTAASRLSNFIRSCPNLISIDKIILPNLDESTSSVTMCSTCKKLTDIVFEVANGGKINYNISFSKDTPLSANTIQSLVSCLENYSVGANKHSLSVSQTTYNQLSDNIKTAINNKGWQLIALS